MLPDKLCFVDIETTGLSVSRDRIIEIGILCIENNKLIQEYQTLINPQMYISPTIAMITGISKHELENAPTFEDVSNTIYSLLDDSVFVAHNVRFDYGFLRNEFYRVNKKFTAKHFCTARLSRKLYPQYEHHNLDSIIERFNFICLRRHRAYDDAKILWNFYEYVKKEIPSDQLDLAISTQYKMPQIPMGVTQKTLDSLPEEPGVYIFYGEHDIPLYVGKSKNIKDRVLSHFSNDYLSSKEMKLCQQVIDIKTIVTSGELSALIKESHMIKKLQPIYNRMLRISKKLIIIKKTYDMNGYLIVYMQVVSSISLTDVPFILGIYRSKKQAKNFLISVGKKYILCEKLLGIEKSNGACFGFRLLSCNGACIKKESPLTYNLRFTEAFLNYHIKSWPFYGPIIITEKNVNVHLQESIFIDKWCLVGNITSTESEIEINKSEKPFDLDVYKILVRFLSKSEHRKFITTISYQKLHALLSNQLS